MGGGGVAYIFVRFCPGGVPPPVQLLRNWDSYDFLACVMSDADVCPTAHFTNYGGQSKFKAPIETGLQTRIRKWLVD